MRKKLLKFLNAPKSHAAAFFTGPGTSAIESMLCSIADAGTKTLVLSNGVYGERMRDILASRGLPFVYLETPAGSFPSAAAIEGRLAADRSIGAVAMVHHETSTGMLNPLGEVARLARQYGKLMIADTISSLGAEKIDLSTVDLCAGTSGKCLHGFPGASFVLVSERCAKRLRELPRRSVSLDLRSALEQAERGETAFTPAVQIFYALDAALDEALAQSLPGRIRSYRNLSETLWAEMDRLGIRFVIDEPRRRSHVLTAFWTPDGVRYDVLHDKLKRAGFVIYAGQSALKDRIFRVANLGAITRTDLKRFARALGSALGASKR